MKKLSLDKFKVQSFVTTVEDSQKETAKGGQDFQPAPSFYYTECKCPSGIGPDICATDPRLCFTTPQVCQFLTRTDCPPSNQLIC